MSMEATASTSRIFSTARTHTRQLFSHPTLQGFPRAARGEGARAAMHSHVTRVSPSSARVRQLGMKQQRT